MLLTSWQKCHSKNPKSFPYIFHFDAFSIAEQIVHTQVEFIKEREVLYLPSDEIVKPVVMLVEHADPDAVGAVTPIAHPKLETSFWIYIPFVDPMVVGYGGTLKCGLLKADRLAWACFSTFSTSFAHLSRANINGLVWDQRQVCEYLTYTNPGAEAGGDE